MTTTEIAEDIADLDCEHGIDHTLTCITCQADAEIITAAELAKLGPCTRCKAPAHHGKICCETCLHYPAGTLVRDWRDDC
jgi:hypothetical protein